MNSNNMLTYNSKSGIKLGAQSHQEVNMDVTIRRRILERPVPMTAAINPPSTLAQPASVARAIIWFESQRGPKKPPRIRDETLPQRE